MLITIPLYIPLSRIVKVEICFKAQVDINVPHLSNQLLQLQLITTISKISIQRFGDELETFKRTLQD